MPKARCPHCNSVIPAGASFCEDCAATLVLSPESPVDPRASTPTVRADSPIRKPSDLAGMPGSRELEVGSTHLTLPEVLEGKYQLLGEIGRGGMGVVLRGLDLALNRQVAIKVMVAPERLASQMVKRFELEARLLASLDHPNIVPIYAFGGGPQYRYFVMKYIEGSDLGRLLRKRMSAAGGGRPLSAPEAAGFLVPIAHALHHAHCKGLVHRDIKPQNILLQDHRVPILVDFGVAHSLQAGEERLTAAGTVVGTPAYMAPELAVGGRPTPASDIHALAIVYYQLVTGKVPFAADSALAILSRVSTDQLPDLEAGPGIADPAQLSAVLHRATSRQPAKRFPSAADFADALQAAAQGSLANLSDTVPDADEPAATVRATAATAGATALTPPAADGAGASVGLLEPWSPLAGWRPRRGLLLALALLAALLLGFLATWALQPPATRMLPLPGAASGARVIEPLPAPAVPAVAAPAPAPAPAPVPAPVAPPPPAKQGPPPPAHPVASPPHGRIQL